MKKISLLLFMFPFLSIGQIQVSTNFNYTVERGLNNETNFAGSGIELSLRKHISDKFRATATTGIYNLKVTLTAVSNYDYTSKTFGYSFKTVLPMTFGGEYYLLSKTLVKPFVGLETGAFYTRYNYQLSENYSNYAMNLPTGEHLNWGFSPSVGIHLQEYADRLGIFLKVKYTGITYSDEYSNLISLCGGVTFKFGKKIRWRPPVIDVPIMTPYYEKK